MNIKLGYWIVTDKGLTECNKKLYDDFRLDNRAAFKSKEEAVEFVLEALCWKVNDLEDKISKLTKKSRR